MNAAATPATVRHCHVCRCTDLDCSGCIQRMGAPCFWVTADLCSACATLEQLLVASLERLRAGASMNELSAFTLRAHDIASKGAGCMACDAGVAGGHWLHSCGQADLDIDPGACSGEVHGYPDEVSDDPAQPEPTALRDRAQVAADRDRPLAWVGRVSAALHDHLGNLSVMGEVSLHVCRDWHDGPMVLLGLQSPWVDDLAARRKGVEPAGGVVLTCIEARHVARLLELAAARAERAPAPTTQRADFDRLVALREAVWAKIGDWWVVTGGGRQRGSLIAKAGVDQALTDLMMASRLSCFCGSSAATLAQAIGEPGLEQDPPVLAARVIERLNVLEAGQMPSTPPELGQLIQAAAALGGAVVAALRDVAEAAESRAPRARGVGEYAEVPALDMAYRQLGMALSELQRQQWAAVMEQLIGVWSDDPATVRQALAGASGYSLAVEDVATWPDAHRRAAMAWAVRALRENPPPDPPAFLVEYFQSVGRVH